MRQFEKNPDVLESIEFRIVEVYRADASLLDADVKDAVDALTRCYHAEEMNRTPPVVRLSERSRRVFESVREVCERWLGRSEPVGTEVEPAPIPVGDMVRCLREIQKSVPLWSKQRGRRGYLDFVSEYF